MKSINIFGSTGIIGCKSLKIIKDYFPKIKFNFLLAHNNYRKLIQQAIIYKPKYVTIANDSKLEYVEKSLKKYKIKVIKNSEINDYLKNTKSDISILSISGYAALKYIEQIIINTKVLGIVNKESIVSGGHFIKKLCLKHNTIIYPLDSEHFSIQQFFDNKIISKKNINNIFITASGGPFLNRNFNEIKNSSPKDTINHPKWNMGIKNSVDSATLVNKCLEIIEAHYLFNIEYKKLNILIHPEALVHSIIEFNDFITYFNYFYHDMFIPLFNFFKHNSELNSKKPSNNIFKIKKNMVLNFNEPNYRNFPILKIFKNMNKENNVNLINFNTGNEYAVKLFINKKIKFFEIINVIEETLSFDLKVKLDNINKILLYQNEVIRKLDTKYL